MPRAFNRRALDGLFLLGMMSSHFCGCAPPVTPAINRPAAKPRRTSAVPIVILPGPGHSPTWSKLGDPSCAFPKEADAAKIDGAEVVVRVRVRVDGSPQAVQTIEEPGFGFGLAATKCAMTRRYQPATDDNGTPVHAWTPPFRIRFVR
jgi:hypothetical protein